MTPADLSTWAFAILSREYLLQLTPSRDRSERLRFLLEAGADPAWHSGSQFDNVRKNWSLATMAAAVCDADAIRLFAAYGVDVNFTGAGPRPPLLHAIGNITHDKDKRTRAARALIDCGADVNASNRNQMLADTPMIQAAQHNIPAIISLLLAKGADIEETNNYGQTALAVAVNSNASDCVELLVNAGATTHHVATFTQKTLLESAEQRLGRRHKITRLLANPPKTFSIPTAPPPITNHRRPAVLNAHELGQWLLTELQAIPDNHIMKPLRPKIVQFLLDAGADPCVRHPSVTMGMAAMETLDASIITMLAAHGTRFDTVNSEGHTPLSTMLARKFDATKENDITSATKALLDITKDATTGNPLLHAAAHGHTGAMRHLIAAGAPLDAVSPFGETPLAAAVLQQQVDAVEILLQAGASLNWHSKSNGKHLLHLAAAYGKNTTEGKKIIQLLQAHKAKLDINKLKNKRPPKPFGPK